MKPEQYLARLQKAERIIEKRGWVKHSYHNSSGVCLEGAINLACGSRAALGNRTSEDVEKFLLVANGFKGGFVIRFNDDPLTTKADVLRWLHVAQAAAREQMKPSFWARFFKTTDSSTTSEHDYKLGG